MGEGATIHCEPASEPFGGDVRQRIESCFAAIGMRARSIFETYVDPPAENHGMLVAAHHFPVNAGRAQPVIIDWKESGDDFQPGDSIHVMFGGDPAGTGRMEYWKLILHFSASSRLKLLSVVSQVERLAEYAEGDRRRFYSLQQLAKFLHREFSALNTFVEVADGDALGTWFKFRNGSDELVPGKFPLP